MRRAAGCSLLSIGGIALSASLFGPATLLRAARGGNDFAAFYTGGRLAFSPELYHREAFIQAQTAWTGWASDELIFVRMPWQALLFSPLGLFPFHAAHLVWTLFCLVAALLFACCWPEVPWRWRAVCMGWSVPLAMTFVGGQDVPLLLGALGAGFLLLERGQEFAAGLCLSLCLAKPHMFWPLGLVLIAHRLWRCVCGMAAGAGVLLALSFLAGGPHWPAAFAGAIGFIDGKANAAGMPTLHPFLDAWPGVEIALVVLLAGLVWRMPDWKTGAAMALLTGILAGRHVFLSDCAFALPALFLVWRDHRARLMLLGAASPVAFVACALGSPQITVLSLLGGVAMLAWRYLSPRPLRLSQSVP